jgi:peptidoglycan/LPS O-acetylase OafA/YrhL
VVIFLGDAVVLKTTHSPEEYLRRLAVGGAADLYYFVPLLVQFYVLSPFITRWAKRRPGLVLLCAAGIQATTHYLLHFSDTALGSVAYPWGFFHWSLFFPLGAVCFLHYKRANEILAHFKWPLLVAALTLLVISSIEAATEFSRTLSLDDSHHILRFSSSLYALAFILTFAAFDKVTIPFSHVLRWLGARSYGVYLLHFSAQMVVAKLAYHFTPQLLKQQILFFPLLLLVGLGPPLLLMKIVARPPLRGCYRYLFGGAPLLPLNRKSAKRYQGVAAHETSSFLEVPPVGTAPTTD